MFEYVLTVIEEVSGEVRDITVAGNDLGAVDIELYWREFKFKLPEEDDYWFTVGEIFATYFDYDGNDNVIEISVRIDSGHESLSIDEVAEKIRVIERINIMELMDYK